MWAKKDKSFRWKLGDKVSHGLLPGLGWSLCGDCYLVYFSCIYWTPTCTIELQEKKKKQQALAARSYFRQQREFFISPLTTPKMQMEKRARPPVFISKYQGPPPSFITPGPVASKFWWCIASCCFLKASASRCIDTRLAPSRIRLCTRETEQGRCLGNWEAMAGVWNSPATCKQHVVSDHISLVLRVTSFHILTFMKLGYCL